MAAGDISLTAVDDFVTFLRDVCEVEASTDPADLRLPGVWVQIPAIDLDTLAGYTIATRLLLVVPDDGPAKAMAGLIALLNKVLAHVDAHGTIEPRTAILPEASAPLPALAVPHNLRANYESE